MAVSHVGTNTSSRNVQKQPSVCQCLCGAALHQRENEIITHSRHARRDTAAIWGSMLWQLSGQFGEDRHAALELHDCVERLHKRRAGMDVREDPWQPLWEIAPNMSKEKRLTQPNRLSDRFFLAQGSTHLSCPFATRRNTPPFAVYPLLILRRNSKQRQPESSSKREVQTTGLPSVFLSLWVGARWGKSATRPHEVPVQRAGAKGWASEILDVARGTARCRSSAAVSRLS